MLSDGQLDESDVEKRLDVSDIIANTRWEQQRRIDKILNDT